MKRFPIYLLLTIIVCVGIYTYPRINRTEEVVLPIPAKAQAPSFEFDYDVTDTIGQCHDTVDFIKENGGRFFPQTAITPSLITGGTKLNESGNIEIAMRDKFGDEVYPLAFTVISPSKEKMSTTTNSDRGDFVSVYYPRDFNSTRINQKGVYGVEFYVKNKKVACDRFIIK